MPMEDIHLVVHQRVYELVKHWHGDKPSGCIEEGSANVVCRLVFDEDGELGEVAFAVIG